MPRFEKVVRKQVGPRAVCNPMASASRPTVVCVTPVKNESWILDRFLACASTWADEIIVADQQSTDATPEIARRAGVTLIDNDSPAYDEGARQRLLLAAARQVAGPRVIVALDADEALTANVTASAEWEAALRARAGTVLRFDWVNVLPGGRRGWIQPEKVAFGFVDDGSDHAGSAIHSIRIPTPDSAPVIDLDDVKALHYQHTNTARTDSKHRWYQCWEMLNGSSKRPVQIFRQYNRRLGFPDDEVSAVDPAWVDSYRMAGHDMADTDDHGPFYWDEQVLDWILEHGAEKFRRLDIWDVDWADMARRLGRSVDPALVRDPRLRFDRAVHSWLRQTQARCGDDFGVRAVQRALIPLRW